MKLTKKLTLASIALLSFTLSYALSIAHPALTQTGEKREREIVVIIPSYNNKDWYEKNLNSVFMQKYENYKVIYINDKSPDGTGKLVQDYIRKIKQEHRFTLINNPKNTGALANIYKAVHTCDDNTIIVTIDGDDWLKDEYVFQKINETYQDPNIWMTYGQYQELHYSKKHNKYFTKKGHCGQIKPNIIRAHAYREDRWITSHLRTFYAGLFKQIKLQDFLEDSQFYQVTWDMAFMMPMLEMAKGKFKFIDDVLYVYNCVTPINDFKTKLIKQLHLEHVIRAKEKYKPTKTPLKKYTQDARADIIIISQNSPTHLQATLESIEFYVSGEKNIYVLYEEKNNQVNQDIQQDIHQNIQTVANDFNYVTFVPHNNLKISLQEILSTCDSTYILIAKDNIIVKDFVNLKKCSQLLDQTYAYGFYFSLGKNIQENSALARKQHIAPHTEIKYGVYAWQFKDGEHDWKMPNNLLMTMYKKETILKTLKNIEYQTCQDLETRINKQNFDANQVGLFFENSKVIAIAPDKPDGADGMKIDILPLFLSKNSSILLKTGLSFCEREDLD
ncbi:glycosyltransferase family 2 protein [Candidatus Dependentiae bacterium]